MNNDKPIKPASEPIVNIHLNELFDLENLQRLQDLFAEAHHVASIITHPDGTPITQPSQFSCFCSIIRKTEKGCANCYLSDALLGRHHPSGPVVQPCLSGGLWDAGASITVNGQHVASWLIGQVRNESVDEQSMLKYAEEIGADPDEFMEAFYQVPIMSVEQFYRVSEMLFAFANELSEKGYMNMQLKRQIAERDRATALLKVSEERFQSLFNKAPLGYQSLDIDGKFIEINEQWLNLLGYTRKEVIGKWFGDFLAPAYVDGFRKRFPLFKAQGHIHSEFEMIHKNGQIIFIDFEGKIGYQLNGEFKQTHCILQDITQLRETQITQRKSEEALKRQNDLFASLLKNLQIGIFMVEAPMGKPLMANQTAQNLLGRGILPDATFHNLSEVYSARKLGTNAPYPPEEMPIIIGMRGESSHIDDMIIERPDGTQTLLEIYGSPVLDENGKVWASLVSFFDITERKLTEVKLKESEAKLSALFGSMTEMVVLHELIFNDQGEAVNYRITDCNQAFTEMTGIKKEEAVGKLATEVYHTDDPPYLEEYSRVAISGVPHEYTTYFPPIDKHFMISAVSPGKNQFAIIGTDITEMKQFSEMISAKNKELENYLYIASHDLRSPLVNIQGFSQRLQKQADTIRTLLANSESEIATRSGIDKITTIDIPKTLHFIFSNVAKMDTLINALLQISRTGQMIMNIQKVTMNKLFHTILLTYNYQITELSARVVLNELPDCYGDENQLNQLFSNIIGNAIKYSDPNRQLVLEINSSINYNKVIYCIKDTGIGMASRHLERIWEVFYQVEVGVSTGGEGIGLSLAKRIVDKHKGKIWVESEEGKGSAFYIELQQHEFTE